MTRFSLFSFVQADNVYYFEDSKRLDLLLAVAVQTVNEYLDDLQTEDYDIALSHIVNDATYITYVDKSKP